VIDTGINGTGSSNGGGRLDSTLSIPIFCVKFSLPICPLQLTRQGFTERTMHRPNNATRAVG
jgi:hypothetical protein